MASSVALIGVGGIGAYHLASIRKLEARGAARLVAVAEPMIERFPELQREFAASGVRWHLDYRDLLREESQLDAVTIAAPIPFHFDMARACLERGVFVNLEKPPVPLVQQLETLIRADAEWRVTVGFQMILSRCVQRMKQLLMEGAVGEVRSLRACGCWPRFDAYYQRASWAGKMVLNGQPVFDGPATNALAHLIHNLMFLAAPGAADFAVPTEVRGELYRARPIESYDVACLRGEFGSGVDFSLAVTHATRESLPFKLEVQGSRGWLRLSEDGGCLETSSGEVFRHASTTQELLDVCHDRFLEGVGNAGQPAYTSLRDTMGYVRATNGLLLSSGGIHNIGGEFVERYEQGGDLGFGFDVRGLRAAVDRVFTEGRLFSELGLDWANARPAPVRLDSFQAVDLGSGTAPPSQPERSGASPTLQDG